MTSFLPWHDTSLFHTHRWPSTSSNPPRALLILLHGFAEHVERYNHAWSTFNEAGIEVFGYDQRGYGRTAQEATRLSNEKVGGKGKAKEEYGNTSIGEALTDLAWAVREERKRLDGLYAGHKVPIILYGHSMGGGLALTFMTLPELASTNITDAVGLVDGVIASSPWITLTHPPDPVSRLAAPLVLRLLPNLPHSQAIDATYLSHDPSIAIAYTSDPLISGNVKMKTVLGPLVTGPKLLSSGIRNWPARVPLLVSHGVQDQVTSANGSKSFVGGVKTSGGVGNGVLDVEWKGWDGMMHEGHNELSEVRDPFLAYSVRWITDHTPSASDSTPLGTQRSNL